MNEAANKSLTTERTPNQIATEINSIKEQTRNMVLFNSIEIGRRLVEVKSMIDHGEWGNWLEKSVDYSKSTANNLMKISKEYGNSQISVFGSSNVQALGNITYTQAVALLGIPSYEREQFAEENDLDSMSTRELQKVIKERDKIQTEKEELFNKLNNTNKAVQQIAEERDKLKIETSSLQTNVHTANQVLRETQNTVKMLQDSLEKERQRTKSEVERLTGLLDEAKAAGDNDKAQKLQLQLSKANDNLRDAKKNIIDLEQQLKEKPVDVPATVEKIPEEVERELEELRKKNTQLENKAGQPESMLKFRVQYEALVEDFKTLLSTLDSIKDIDIEGHKKYKSAVIGLVRKMLEKL